MKSNSSVAMERRNELEARRERNWLQTMKTKNTWMNAVVVSLLILVTEAGAYYDPGLQRWLSRDPVQEDGGVNLYGFVENRPIDNFDPYGLWSPEAHDCLIQHALKGMLPQKDIDAIKKSSRDFDKKTQSAEDSYKHSMKMKGQSGKDAIKARDRFIERKCAEACQAYKNNNKQKALQLLGEALHPVMDSASPEHTSKKGNPKTWNPHWPFGHSPTDWMGNETSKDITPAIYKKQDEAIRATCEKVFGK